MQLKRINLSRWRKLKKGIYTTLRACPYIIERFQTGRPDRFYFTTTDRPTADKPEGQPVSGWVGEFIRPPPRPHKVSTPVSARKPRAARARALLHVVTSVTPRELRRPYQLMAG